MLPPLPRRSDWVSCMLIPPVVSAFPDRVVGSACASSFSRFAQRSLALRPAHSRCHQFVTRLPEGFSHFVTSMTAPVASGWSGCRAGLTPAGKRHLFTAHTRSGHRRPRRNRERWFPESKDAARAANNSRTGESRSDQRLSQGTHSCPARSWCLLPTPYSVRRQYRRIGDLPKQSEFRPPCS